VLGALLIDRWDEAATVVLLFSAAQWLEAQSLDRARRAIGGLLDAAPSDVLVREAAGDRRVPIDSVSPGAVMIVRPGDRIPLDGRVFDGRSAVNQAPITGESLPVDKAPGDPVYAGSLNGHGALTAVVTARRPDTALARIVHMVEAAQASRAPTQLFIDRFAAWYTPAVVALAALVVAVPVVIAGQPFDVWFYRALVLLVVACPCALVISTPVSIVSALAGAARRGVLIKGGAHIERLAGIRALAFDKTGTLTTGQLTVAGTRGLGGYSDTDVVSLAACVEARSEHPVAAAILDEARARGLVVVPADAVRAFPGQGVDGMVEGRPVACGTARWFADRGWLTPELSSLADELAARGLSPVLVARDGVPVGATGIVDALRPSAAAVVAALRRLGVQRVALLSGDQPAAARAAGAAVGADIVRAALLPSEKVDAVRALQRESGPVAMIGDGVNDAPALAAADVGLVMGAIGSAAALETADIALMNDDLWHLPYVLQLSRATLVNIRANVIIALLLKAAFLALTVAGAATLWMAVAADSGASLLVVANALRLRWYAAPEHHV